MGGTSQFEPDTVRLCKYRNMRQPNPKCMIGEGGHGGEEAGVDAVGQ